MTTSRERVADAVNFREPDRVPIDLGGHKASGIAVETYRRRIRAKLEIPTTTGLAHAAFEFLQENKSA